MIAKVELERWLFETEEMIKRNEELSERVRPLQPKKGKKGVEAKRMMECLRSDYSKLVSERSSLRIMIYECQMDRDLEVQKPILA